MIRFGLLTAAVANSIAFLLFNSPLTFDTSAWFFPRSAVVHVYPVPGAAAVEATLPAD